MISSVITGIILFSVIAVSGAIIIRQATKTNGSVKAEYVRNPDARNKQFQENYKDATALLCFMGAVMILVGAAGIYALATLL